ncbi:MULTISPECIES: hypothetical protein [unclassified Microbacterium]|uniref:hypothetical protein n=1 Tax=unclassified Microbacterium TaxID=2609290 RepID=UPI00203FF048|nr:hypothetical protein [Microbacterium sp. USTB-Y]
MTNPLGISDARALLRTRAQLRSAGTSERAIDAALAAGELLRLRRDRYVDAAAYEALWSEGRHLVQTVAAAKNLDDHGAVFWGPSAAVLHGLPLYRLRPASVHTVILGGHHGRVRAGVRQHEVSLGVGDVIDIDGILCTSLDRTILDLACTVPAEAAVCAADAAQRRETVVGNEFRADRAALWHARLADRAAASRAWGIRGARELLAFADGRAQLPGESVSRLQLHRLGFRGLLLQVPVTGADGDRYWLDFGFPRAKVFGEFDGRGKYLDDDLREGRAADEVVLDEKRREDDVRGVTGWRFARWDSTHIGTAEILGRRLARFGVRPPG